MKSVQACLLRNNFATLHLYLMPVRFALQKIQFRNIRSRVGLPNARFLVEVLGDTEMARVFDFMTFSEFRSASDISSY
jgi:hypothetical protein